MENFIQFLVKYWQYISIALVVLLELILMILKRRKPVALTDGQYQGLINWIQEAEKLFGAGNGDKKLSFVIEHFRQAYPSSFAEDWVIRSTVNDILKCPTKKGGLGREQIEQKSKQEKI